MKLKPKWKKPNGVKAATLQPSSGSSPGRNGAEQQGPLDRHPATSAKQSKMSPINLATWNVRTLYQAGQLENLKQELQAVDIDVLGVCETRWTGNGKFNSDDFVMLYSGGKTHSNGVGIIIKKQFAESIIGCWAISDRVVVIKLKGTPVNINVIEAYAPTSSSSEADLETFYDDLDKAMSICKNLEIKIVMGDFNAKICEGRQDLFVGPHGLGDRNERGDVLMEWCEEKELVITNTLFKQHKHRLFTWKSPDEQTRNQIDYILINQRFRNAVKSCKAYPSADCNSDHNLLMATIFCKMKKMKNPKAKPNVDLKILKHDVSIQKQYAVEVNNRFEQLGRNENTAEEDWNQIEEVLQNTAEKLLPPISRDRKQRWMNNSILELMKQRKSVKNKNTVKYKSLNIKIQTESKKAKEAWIEEQCKELEDLEKKNIQHMYNKITGMSKRKCRPANTALRTKDGRVVMGEQDILSRWTEYIGDLFDDTSDMLDFDRDEELSGNEILESEVEAALKEMKSGKAPGNDKVFAELLIACKDINVKKLCILTNKIYNTGVIPKQMKESIFIPIPKKGDLLECGNYRLISLTSHITKIILRIIMRRVRSKLLPEISEEQFGFKKDCGTRDAIFMLRILGERSN